MADNAVYVKRINTDMVLVVLCSPRILGYVDNVVNKVLSGSSVRCSSCGRDLTLAMARCPICGKTIPFIAHTCPHCGRDVSVKRCVSCGKPIYYDGRLFKPSKIPSLILVSGGIALGLTHYILATASKMLSRYGFGMLLPSLITSLILITLGALLYKLGLYRI